MLDQLGDRGLRFREAADDPQAVDVGERLVDEAQGAQVIRLVEDGRDRRADSGWGGAQGEVLQGVAPVGSTALYINRR